MNDKLKKWIPWGAVLLAGFGLGYLIAPSSSTNHEHGSGVAATQQSKVKYWTCSMHPQVKSPTQGKCPLCGMDLIPVSEGGDGEDEGVARITMSETGKKLAEIVTSRVTRRFVKATIRMVGKVDYDETRLFHITAWMGGRLDRLFVDYTGVPVKKGDHMVEIYSPELVSAQEEYLVAIKNLKQAATPGLVKINERMAEATRQKLLLWGLMPKQLKELKEWNKPSEHIIIYAPTGGIVIEKHALEGSYVDTGTRIYTIADLSHLWVKLDAYESDLSWIRYGQKVEFTTESYPGKVFKGRIAFIDPVLNAKTRTVKLRVNVDNPEGKLKPEMFVRAVVKVGVSEGGKVRDNYLAGKWIGPMHPEIVRDHPGKCPVCGMPLVSTKSLGYLNGGGSKEAPLVIPASAPLITGERAVVYVEDPTKDRPTYEGREVVLGARAGDYYLVESGLKEGELVVTQGNFKIDSALQIQAKPSMMSHDPGEKSAKSEKKKEALQHYETPEEFKEQLSKLSDGYMAVNEGLVASDVNRSKNAAKEMMGRLSMIMPESLSNDARRAWKRYLTGLHKGLHQIIDGKKIEDQRKGFVELSETISAILKSFGHTLTEPVRVFHCPMAFGKGANWLQLSKDTRNPYYGAAMLKCGDQVDSIPASKETKPVTGPVAVPEEFKKQLSSLSKGYMAVSAALVAADAKQSKEAARELMVQVTKVSDKTLSAKTKARWKGYQADLHKGLHPIIGGKTIEEQRQGFALLSETVSVILKSFGHTLAEPVRIFHCPMAFGGRGGNWLQLSKDTRNPYFGAAMLKCGDQVDSIKGK